MSELGSTGCVLADGIFHRLSGGHDLCGAPIEVLDQDLSLRDPVRAIKEVSHDPSLERTVELQTGKKLTAVQMQGEFLEMAASR